MKAEVTTIFENLFSQNPHHERNSKVLLHLANTYPYFAPAQFALAADLKKENNSFNALSQQQKAVLFFLNTKWFEYLLSDDAEFDGLNSNKEENKTVENIETVESEIPISATPSDISSSLDETKNTLVEEENETVENVEKEIPISTTPSDISSSLDEIKNIVSEEENKTVENIETVESEIPISTTPSDISSSLDEIKNIVSEEENKTVENIKMVENEIPISATPSDISSSLNETKSTVVEEENKLVENIETVEKEIPISATPSVPTSSVEKTKNIVEEENETVEKEIPISAMPSVPPSSIEEPKNIVSEEENEFEEEENDETTETVADEVLSSKISSVLSSQLDEIKKAVDENAKLDFEKEIPPYVIDYLEWIGITLDPSELKNDKLTQQVMSFTDWLKRMKKFNYNNQMTNVDHAIQKLAENSNISKDILTETMADVFAKQGSIDKAVQLYSKLSFLYPEKSAYFAAKIQKVNTK